MFAADLTAHLLLRLRQVQGNLGHEVPVPDRNTCFAEAVDSMGLVEFVGLLADDCGVSSMAIEKAAGHHFGTVADLAAALFVAGLQPCAPSEKVPASVPMQGPTRQPLAWLTATAVGLPVRRQPTTVLDALLHRPSGWLSRHAGIQERRVWGEEDALERAARTAREALDRAQVSRELVGALLVTSEAPPLGVGLAASLHHRLGLSSHVPALEMGSACTGFLAALWMGQRLLSEASVVLVLAVEGPSRWLDLRPGLGGEAAALFGDGAAACVLGARPAGAICRPLVDVILSVDGGAGSLLQVRTGPNWSMELSMEGPALARRAVLAMAQAVRQVVGRHGLSVRDLEAVVVHGGNGRMPALVARQLGLTPERVWSETPHTGNLGSASLPAAWAMGEQDGKQPVVWTAVGAGLTWGAALLGAIVA